jgi:hypothetical protein
MAGIRDHFRVSSNGPNTFPMGILEKRAENVLSQRGGVEAVTVAVPVRSRNRVIAQMISIVPFAALGVLVPFPFGIAIAMVIGAAFDVVTRRMAERAPALPIGTPWPPPNSGLTDLSALDGLPDATLVLTPSRMTAWRGRRGPTVCDLPVTAIDHVATSYANVVPGWVILEIGVAGDVARVHCSERRAKAFVELLATVPRQLAGGRPEERGGRFLIRAFPVGFLYAMGALLVVLGAATVVDDGLPLLAIGMALAVAGEGVRRVLYPRRPDTQV